MSAVPTIDVMHGLEETLLDRIECCSEQKDDSEVKKEGDEGPKDKEG